VTRRSRAASILLAVAVVTLAIVTLAPLVWLVIMSVSSTTDLTSLPLRWIPRELDLSRYRRLLTPETNTAGEAFLYALRNSLAASLGATLIAFAAGIPAAYSFSRYPGRRMSVLYAVLATYMMPPVALVLPLYMMFSTLGLLNNVLALVIVYCTILLPFTTWLLKSSFDAVPIEIEHAAAMDGAGVFGVLRFVTLPLARAALGTAALFAMLIAWDEFFYALIYTSDIRAKTLTVAIADFAAGRTADYGLISAAGVLASLPPVIIAVILQRSLVKGLAAGGIKG
jgi:multiple sugar transport system permease protein